MYPLAFCYVVLADEMFVVLVNKNLDCAMIKMAACRLLSKLWAGSLGLFAGCGPILLSRPEYITAPHESRYFGRGLELAWRLLATDKKTITVQSGKIRASTPVYM